MTNVLAESVVGDSTAKAKITRYCASLTPLVAMNPAREQLSLMRRNDPSHYEKSVGLALIRMTELINVTNTMTTDQLDDLIARIGGTYYYLRFDEVLYVLEKGINGRFGRMFNELDANVVMSWFEQYDVEERTDQAIELSRGKHTKRSDPLTNQELQAFYEKAGIKPQNPLVDNSHVRTAQRALPDNQKYETFKARYLKQQREANTTPTDDHQPDSARIEPVAERAPEDAPQ